MTSLTGPLIVTSAKANSDGTAVFRVSGNGHIAIDADATSEAVTGGGGAVPATAATFLKVSINGTELKIPAFN